MENDPNRKNNIEQVQEIATDLEVAMFLINHIDNPCEAEVQSGQFENIRDFYIREAERILEKMTNLEAKKLLELKIAEYKK